MSYMFTIEQLQQLTVLFGNGPQPGQSGNFGPMYAYVVEVLTTPDSNGNRPDDDIEVKKSRLWFNGAERQPGPATGTATNQ